jgi:hypothetical protein
VGRQKRLPHKSCSKFEDFTEAVFDRFKIFSRQTSQTSIQALFSDGSHLVSDSNDVASIAVHGHQ